MSTQTVGPSDPRLEPPRLLLTGEPGAHSAGRPDLKLAYARIRRGAIRGAAEDSPPWQITIVPPVGDVTLPGSFAVRPLGRFDRENCQRGRSHRASI